MKCKDSPYQHFEKNSKRRHDTEHISLISNIELHRFFLLLKFFLYIRSELFVVRGGCN
jgi:hypothetical protein